jgi:hypothetical protein
MLFAGVDGLPADLLVPQTRFYQVEVLLRPKVLHEFQLSFGQDNAARRQMGAF